MTTLIFDISLGKVLAYDTIKSMTYTLYTSLILWCHWLDVIYERIFVITLRFLIASNVIDILIMNPSLFKISLSVYY